MTCIVAVSGTLVWAGPAVQQQAQAWLLYHFCRLGPCLFVQDQLAAQAPLVEALRAELAQARGQAAADTAALEQHVADLQQQLSSGDSVPRELQVCENLEQSALPCPAQPLQAELRSPSCHAHQCRHILLDWPCVCSGWHLGWAACGYCMLSSKGLL